MDEARIQGRLGTSDPIYSRAVWDLPEAESPERVRFWAVTKVFQTILIVFFVLALVVGIDTLIAASADSSLALHASRSSP
jgi:hypothetical protein